MLPADQAPPGNDWLVRRLADLERQVKELQAARRLESATIGSGGLTVQGGRVRIVGEGRLTSEYESGQVALDLGAFTLGGEPVHGVIVRRPGGETAFWTYGEDDSGSSFWSLFDLAGNIVMSDDATSGQGLATPYVPYTGVRSSDMATPPVVSTSSTFAEAFRIHGPKQHPKIKVLVFTKSDAGTTGEVRLVNFFTGVQLGSVVSFPASDNSYRYLEAEIPGDHLSDMFVSVELRRTAGTGNARVGFCYAEGKQS